MGLLGPNFGTIVTSSGVFVPEFASSRPTPGGCATGSAMPSLAGYASAGMTWMLSGVTT